jgi:transposase
MKQTAEAIGISAGWACRLRTQFIREGGMPRKQRPSRGGRHRENMTREEEAAFLTPYFEKAQTGGVLIVGEIKQALDARLGRTVALASAYNLLHRHGWRKIVPDKRHPQADVKAQEDWKKNSPSTSRKSTVIGRGKAKLS